MAWRVFFPPWVPNKERRKTKIDLLPAVTSGWKERREWAEQRGRVYEVLGARAELV